jgi:hypothetical protein
MPSPSQYARVSARHEALAAEALERAPRARTAIAPPKNAAAYAKSVLAPLLKDKGVSLSDLARHWPEIVGERLAGLTAPEKLSGGTLTVRAHSSAAPFVQHQSRLIIERANLAGANLTTLAIKHGAPAARKAANIAPLAKPLTAEEEAAIAAALRGFADGRLRDALMRLGKAVAAR